MPILTDVSYSSTEVKSEEKVPAGIIYPQTGEAFLRESTAASGSGRRAGWAVARFPLGTDAARTTGGWVDSELNERRAPGRSYPRFFASIV